MFNGIFNLNSLNVLKVEATHSLDLRLFKKNLPPLPEIADQINYQVAQPDIHLRKCECTF